MTQQEILMKAEKMVEELRLSPANFKNYIINVGKRSGKSMPANYKSYLSECKLSMDELKMIITAAGKEACQQIAYRKANPNRMTSFQTYEQILIVCLLLVNKRAWPHLTLQRIGTRLTTLLGKTCRYFQDKISIIKKWHQQKDLFEVLSTIKSKESSIKMQNEPEIAPQEQQMVQREQEKQEHSDEIADNVISLKKKAPRKVKRNMSQQKSSKKEFILHKTQDKKDVEEMFNIAEQLQNLDLKQDQLPQQKIDKPDEKLLSLSKKLYKSEQQYLSLQERINTAQKNYESIEENVTRVKAQLQEISSQKGDLEERFAKRQAYNAKIEQKIVLRQQKLESFLSKETLFNKKVTNSIEILQVSIDYVITSTTELLTSNFETTKELISTTNKEMAKKIKQTESLPDQK